MRLPIFLALGLFSLVLLSHAAFAAPAWWGDMSCTSRREIRLPDQDINAYTVIQVASQSFAGTHWVIDHNAARSGDENVDSILDTGTDGNLFFQLTNPISSGQSESDRYQTYYDYYDCDAGELNDENAARHDICSAEDSTNFCGLAAAVRDTDQAMFGAASMSGNNIVEQPSVATLGSKKDFNYTGWVYTHDAGLSTFMVLTVAGAQICMGGILADQFYYKDASSHYVGTADDNTWYQVVINYRDGDDSATEACKFTWKDTNGNALNAANSGYKANFGVVDGIDLYFNSGGSSTTYWDNFYYGPPIVAVGLGGVEVEAVVNPDVNVWKIEGYDVVEEELPSFNYADDGNLTIDFNVFNPDNNRMTVDMNYSTSSAQGGGTVIVNDWTMGSAVCADQDWNDTPSSCALDWNISGVLDGNYFILIEVIDTNGATTAFDVSPKSLYIPNPTLRMFVKDENVGVPLDSVTVTALGTTHSVSELGYISLDLAGSTGTQIIAISEDNNYPTRYFTIDVNAGTTLDLNAVMLKQEDGRAVHFLFYGTDGTTVMANKKVRLIRDGNFAGIRYTNAAGQTSFFMDMDGNYVFDLVDSETEIIRYHPVTLNVRVPKDEGSVSTAITPFDLTVSGLNDTAYTGSSVDINYRVFPNTTGFFVFDVNAGLNYYSRRYYYNTTGNPTSDILQPYLVKVVDSLDVALYTKNAIDLTVEPNILIIIYKIIPGEGRVEDQSVRTDDSGTASVSFIDGDEYELEFYDVNNNHLFNKTLRPEFTSYYFYIDTQEFDIPDTLDVESITVTGLPTTGYIVYGDEGFDFNITVSVANGTIGTSWLTVKNDIADQNLVFNTACGSGCSYNVARADLDMNNTITVKVFVKTASGMIYEQEFFYVPVDEATGNLVATLRSAEFRQQWGCSTDPNDPCFFLLIVSTFIILAMLATAHEIAVRDTNALSILAIIGMGLFVYLTWIPLSFFILACLGAFGGFIVSRREA